MREYLLIEYLLKYPLHPHSLHLKIPHSFVILIKASNQLRLLDLLILPTFVQDGHLEVSGKTLKRTLNCNALPFQLKKLFIKKNT